MKVRKKKVKTMLENAHEMAQGLHKIGAIDAVTMREFDSLCLPEIEKFSSSQIKKIRLREKISQSVFARYLNTSVSTIRQWEQGEKHPRGTSLKLLNLVAEKGLAAIL